jgi:hypothetical protein
MSIPSRSALAAAKPAINNSESPGKKKPTSNPVSAKTIAKSSK